MQATVTTISPVVKARVRRGYQDETIQVPKHCIFHPDRGFKVGDKIEVRRQVNNPYLVFVSFLN